MYESLKRSKLQIGPGCYIKTRARGGERETHGKGRDSTAIEKMFLAQLSNITMNYDEEGLTDCQVYLSQAVGQCFISNVTTVQLKIT